MMLRSGWMYRWRRPISLTLLGFFGAATTVSAQNIPDLPGAPVAPPPPPRAASGPGLPGAPGSELAAAVPAAVATRAAQSLNFRDAPIDMVLEYVADLLGRTLIKSPGVNAQITLKSNGKLTVDESLQAIEAVLAMSNITLVPMGEKFLKVVQTAEARTHAMPLSINLPGAAFNDDDKLVSQVVQLKYIEIGEATPILDSLKRAYGKIQALERTNSLLITDTQGNLKRMLEILEYLDQPAEAQVETRIYELRYAEAGLIAGRLNELIADSQSKEEKPRVEQAAPAANAPPNPPGVIRAPRAATGATGGGAAGGNALEQAERGVIRGKVKIISDERTNIIFVISRPENFAFFDKIVAVLDRPVEAAIGVRVVPLEYAKAEDIAGILNEFIGAASSEKKTSGTASAGDNPNAPAGEGARSTELRDFLRGQAQAKLEQAQTQLQQADGKGTIGRLSPTTKILADKRTNSLLLMGRKGDLDALELVLDSLDIMLAQVLIETVILEVNLGDTVDTGFDWLQRSVIAYNEAQSGPNGGVTVRTPVFSFGGGSVQDSGSFRGGDTITRNNNGQAAGGMSYYATFNDLNLDTILRLAGSSSDARVVSTPVVLTTDNTEAKIVAAEQRPVVTSTSLQTTGQQNQNFEYRNIGINIAVTPRINPSGFVMMEIEQSADDVLGETTINNTTVPIISKRELSAQVGVQSRQTVVLGGLVRTDNSKSRSKVPFLGDIPLLGMFFRADSKKRNRTELMVLLTPYVLKTPQEALDETHRLYDNSKNSESGWHKGWSDSPLPRTPEDLLKQEKARQQSESGRQRMKKQTLLDTFSAEPAPVEPGARSKPLDQAPAEPVPVVEVTPPVERAEPKVAVPAPTPAAPEVPAPPVDPSESLSSAEDAPNAPVPVR